MKRLHACLEPIMTRRQTHVLTNVRGIPGSCRSACKSPRFAINDVAITGCQHILTGLIINTVKSCKYF